MAADLTDHPKYTVTKTASSSDDQVGEAMLT